MTTVSPQRKTADALVAAFNAMDVDTILALRTPSSTRHIIPSTLNIAPQTNAQYRTQLEQLRPIFCNFSLTVHDVLEDREAGRLCMWLKARADTVVGEYVNEYMWVLEFDESGEKVANSTEFVDTLVNREFWPKLREAMKAQREAEAQKTSSSA